jgi:hypothetical protein
MPSTLSQHHRGCQFYGVALYPSEDKGKPIMGISPMQGIASPPIQRNPVGSHVEQPSAKKNASSLASSILANGWCVTGQLDGWGGKMRLFNPKN